MLKKYLTRTHFLVTAITVVILAGTVIISVRTLFQIKQWGKNSTEPGFEFIGLKKSLKGVEIVGYLSDKEQTSEGNDGRFMMAQYILAPTLLDLNNPNYRFCVLDCSTPQAATHLIEKLNARIITSTPFGKILIERSL